MKVFRNMFEDVHCVLQVNLAIESWVCTLHFQFLLDLGKVFPWILLVVYLCRDEVMIIIMLWLIDLARCILMPCTKQVTAEQTTQLFFQNFWVHFGLPKSIISDRDSRFFGSFWSNLWVLMDTKLKKSTTFHSQKNGQTKVVNRTVVHLLCGYCNKHPKLWDEHLHYIQHAYNRAKHSSTQTSPFEECFVYLPKSPLDFIFGKDIAIDGQYDIDRVEKLIEQIQLIHQMVQEQLEKS